MFKKLKKLIFRNELKQLEDLLQKNKELNGNVERLMRLLDVSVDVDLSRKYRSSSWAVISLQGQKNDFIKFVDLSDSDLMHIQHFLRQFERNNIKVDAAPNIRMGLKFNEFMR